MSVAKCDVTLMRLTVSAANFDGTSIQFKFSKSDIHRANITANCGIKEL